MVLDLIVHYIIANSYMFQKITITPRQTSAYKKWISNVSNSNNWHICLPSKFTVPQSRQHIIVSKLKLTLSSFVLFLECLHERFKTVLRNCIAYWVKYRTPSYFHHMPPPCADTGVRTATSQASSPFTHQKLNINAGWFYISFSARNYRYIREETQQMDINNCIVLTLLLYVRVYLPVYLTKSSN